MTIDRIKEFDKYIGKNLTELPNTPDQILLILRGHLLVEQEINCLLEVKLPNPKVLKLRKKDGPRFSHKVCLLEALIPKPKYAPGLWKLCKKLNKLRNELSHKLSPNDIDKKIDEFVFDVLKSKDTAMLSKNNFLRVSNELNRRLRMEGSLSIVLSYLVQMREIV